MNRLNRIFLLIAVSATAVCGVLMWAQQPVSRASEPVVVTLCDGRTEVPVPGLKPGEKLARPEAQLVANFFLAEWRKANPGAAWEMAAAAKRAPAAKPAPQAKQFEIYNRVTPREEFVWKTELEKFVKEGDRIFHDASAFGGTVGISCDMCHPNASNTHPETYPKYQVQLQRVALLRDMINWCIQHPTKGKPLPDDDQRLRAMEAYILAQREGKAIEPGKR
jgi:thiosulfate dehydrogenase